jgi:hypothetical protein
VKTKKKKVENHFYFAINKMSSPSGDNSSGSIDFDHLIGPLSAALAPSIVEIINNEFSKRVKSKKSEKDTSRRTVVESENDSTSEDDSSVHFDGGRSTPDTKRCQKGAGGGTGPRKNNRKRPHEEDEKSDDGELTSASEDEMLDPVAMYSEAEKVWSAPRTTRKYLQSYVRRSLSSEERKSIMEKFPLPDGPEVKLPKVDEAFMHLLRQERVTLK